MLIGVTSFFRDREVFETLKNSVLPRILERRSPESPIRAWIAGCSSGEEAYSVAMCLLEQLGDKAQSTKIQIFATDLDEDAIRQARTGTYRSNIELDVSAERLRRFFVRKEEEYQVSRQIRDMVVFATQDLTKDPPFSRLDLVCCRNVLIYMQPALQKRVLRVFHYALNPDGFMLLGTSETVGEAAELFSVVDRKLKIYFKRNIPASATFDFGFEGQHLPVEEPARGQHEARPLLTLQQLADRKVIERFGPPGVVINDALEVLQFRGRTGPYLEPAPGAATLNVLKLARPELLVELRNTIHKALSENFQASSGPVQVKAEQGYREVAIEALPLQEAGVPPRCLLVLFREMTPPPAAKPASETNEPKDPRLIELERELSSTKNFLQTTIEELEAANEELKSANEELQSSNEELQSTNEELETSKEELQSTNEELATVNEELQNRMAELGQNNDDLQNVLSVSHNPLVIVGLDLRIRRFSQSAERLLNLIAGDIGRPIAHLTGTLNTPRLELLVADAVNNVVAQEVELSTADKHNYFLRILPYKTADHAIRGALLEFVRLGLTAPA
jgi:two-component system CheB/CheR fusion protein